MLTSAYLLCLTYLDVTLRCGCEEECGGGGVRFGGEIGADVDVRRSTVSAGEIRGEVGRQDKDGDGGLVAGVSRSCP